MHRRVSFLNHVRGTTKGTKIVNSTQLPSKHSTSYIAARTVARWRPLTDFILDHKRVSFALMFGLFLSASLHPNHVLGQSEKIGGFIVDNFDEADYLDGLPATWSILGAGEAKYDASSGDLLIDRTGDEPDVPPDWAVTYVERANTMLSDVSIRAVTQIWKEDRTNAPDSDPNFGPAVTLAARTCFNEIPHVCGGDPNNWIYIDFYSNGEAHTRQSNETNIKERVVQTDIRPLNEEVVLQLDAFGDDIKFWVWRPGERRPDEPIVHYTEQDMPTLDPGGVMFGTVFADAWFRSVQISDTPITDNPPLFPGDADQDNDFDQLDLVQVQIAGRYLTGQPATWGEGDWDSAPGGTPGAPPAGNGLFDQLDIIAAASSSVYLTGPYAAIGIGGAKGDDQTSLVYDAATGELAVDAPVGLELTSINVTSNAGMFIGSKPAVLDGAFDNFAADNVFKATFGGSFGSISFGNVLPSGIGEADLVADLSAVGSLAGGGDLGDVDFVYVPEPASVLLLLAALLGSNLRWNYPTRWGLAQS